MNPANRPIVLFGATTPSGAAFLNLAAGRSVLVAGRRCPAHWPPEHFLRCDLGSPAPPADLIRPDAVVVSFAPIWSLAPFLASLLAASGSKLDPKPSLCGVVACSSSSVLTKRFAANRFDRDLVRRLATAEDTIEACSNAAGISCRILQPSLIYGQAGEYGDQNLSRLLQLMARLPVLPIPAETGLRQPIHARQLAAVALHLVGQPNAAPRRTAVGGDECLSYASMLERLREAALLRDQRDPVRRCRLLPLPNRLFHLLAAPLLPVSAKGFEAVLRIEANLADFPKAHSILGTAPQRFPVAPLAPSAKPKTNHVSPASQP
jgi:hypothetical protein